MSWVDWRLQAMRCTCSSRVTMGHASSEAAKTKFGSN
jgi:hypothetical protein